MRQPCVCGVGNVALVSGISITAILGTQRRQNEIAPFIATHPKNTGWG